MVREIMGTPALRDRSVTQPKIVTLQIIQSRNRRKEKGLPNRVPRCTTIARHSGVPERCYKSKGIILALAAWHFRKHVERRTSAPLTLKRSTALTSLAPKFLMLFLLFILEKTSCDTWMHHYELHSKKQSTQWSHPKFPKPNQSKS